MQKLVNRKGFTLVELVVVIAVLAILAGVGVVAYNGYITYAQKGKDRALVGEVMHAIELADYSDSSLIPEGNSAMVFLTSSGTYAFDGEKTTEFTASMADALGDLSTVKLSYEKWNEEEGNFELAAVNTLLEGMKGKWTDETSSINKYLKNGGSASFAGNIEENWKSVQDYISLFSSFYEEGGSDPDKDYLLSAVVNESIDPTLASKYVEYFGKGGTDSSLNPASKSYRAAAVASNYAFAAWLNLYHSADITADMEEKYDSLTSVAAVVENFYAWKDDPDWKDLIEEYYTSQGETDMLAYLGMLEAAKTMEPAEGRLKDVDFVPQAGKVVNVAAGILNRSVNHTALEDLAKSLAENGGENIICVFATKVNGQLSIEPKPKSASPRTDNNSSSAGGSCDKGEHTGSSVTLNVSSDGMNYKVDSDIVLCTKDSSYGSSVISFNYGSSINNAYWDSEPTFTMSDSQYVSFDPSTKTLRALKKGSADVTIMINVHMRDIFEGAAAPDVVEPSDMTYTIKIHVIVH